MESDILSVEILSISERQQPLTGSCNGMVRFTTMVVLRMPLQAARKVKGKEVPLWIFMPFMSLDGKVCGGHRPFRIISASKKLRMTFCLTGFGKWNDCRAKDEALWVSEDNLIESGCLSFRGEQQWQFGNNGYAVSW